MVARRLPAEQVLAVTPMHRVEVNQRAAQRPLAEKARANPRFALILAGVLALFNSMVVAVKLTAALARIAAPWTVRCFAQFPWRVRIAMQRRMPVPLPRAHLGTVVEGCCSVIAPISTVAGLAEVVVGSGSSSRQQQLAAAAAQPEAAQDPL